MKTGTMPYSKMNGLSQIYNKVKGNRFLSYLMSKKIAILLPLAFLMGRATFIGGMMPFGISIYAATFGMKVDRLPVAIFVLIGMISGGNWEQIYIAAVAMILFNAFNIPFKQGKTGSSLRQAVIIFISMLIPQMVMVFLQGFLLYDFLTSLLYAITVTLLMFILKKVIPLVTDMQKNKVLSVEEIISIAIAVSVAISALSGIYIIGTDIRNIFCILTILIFSYRCGPGIGASIGVTVGFIETISATGTPILIGSYALSGLLSGVFGKMGKVGSSLGFVLGSAILTIYLSGSSDMFIHLKEIILAVVIFISIPEKMIIAVTGILQKRTDKYLDRKMHSFRIKEITIDKLDKFSRAFRELSRTFNEIAQVKMVSDKQDVASMFDRVADKVCRDCSLSPHCWDRNFYSTYQIMFKIIEKLDSKGRVEESDIPDYFINRCERVNVFVETVNNIYEIFKVDMIWKNRIGESRGIVSQQLEGLSRVISNLASELKEDVCFKTGIEETILLQMNKVGIMVEDVIVFVDKGGKYNTTVFYKKGEKIENCIDTIERLISGIVGKKMITERNEYRGRTQKGLCVLKMIQEETFKVIVGVAKVPKYKSAISGDSYTFINNDNGKFIVALSDGMGSGQRAAAQSKATVNLIEQFMESGFDKDMTVKLINSTLLLKSGDDSFVSIDLCLIDLYEGEVEFVKIGAVPTFVRKGGKLEVVKCASLPAGILSNIELELVRKKVDDGDFVIMMTDGVFDSFKECKDNEKSIFSFLQEIKSINPQNIADCILNRANENYGWKPADDMMVVVAKVWRNNGV